MPIFRAISNTVKNTINYFTPQRGESGSEKSPNPTDSHTSNSMEIETQIEEQEVVPLLKQRALKQFQPAKL